MRELRRQRVLRIHVLAAAALEDELHFDFVVVNDRRISEDYVRPQFKDDETHAPVTVAKGYYYVLGDHRNSSNDSRSWGEVPEKYIYGKAVFRFWPLSKIGFIR